VMVGDVELSTNLAELGVHTDTDQLVADAFAARKGGVAIFRPFSWIGSFFGDEPIERQLLVDELEAETNTMTLIEGQLTEPTDPTFSVTASGVTVMAGIDGATIELAGIAAQVQTALDNGEPFVVSIAPIPLPPSLETATLQTLADEANDATSNQLEVTVLTQSVVVEPDMIRSWVTLDVSGTAPAWRLDNTKLVDDLQPLFPALGSAEQVARFDVVNGSPVIIPANESVQCCGEKSSTSTTSPGAAPRPMASFPPERLPRASSKPRSAAASASSSPRCSMHRSSPAWSSSSTRRTRCTSVATPEAVKQRSRSRSRTSSFATPRPTAFSFGRSHHHPSAHLPRRHRRNRLGLCGLPPG